VRLSRASGARGFHPHALSEPYVNLSIHTAPIIQSFSETPPSVQRDEVVAAQRHATISPQEQSDVSVICTLSRPTASNTCPSLTQAPPIEVQASQDLRRVMFRTTRRTRLSVAAQNGIRPPSDGRRHIRDFQRAYRAGFRDAIKQLAQLTQAETDERKRLLLEERRAQFQTALHNNPVT
jgi:hypothetical protein